MSFLLDLIGAIIEFIAGILLAIPWWVYVVVLFIILLTNFGWTVWWLQ